MGLTFGGERLYYSSYPSTGYHPMLIFSIVVIVWLLCARYTYKLANIVDSNADISEEEDKNLRMTFLLLWPIMLVVLLFWFVTEKWDATRILDIIFGTKPH